MENFGEEVQAPDEPERPLKRLRLRGQETQVDGMALKKPKLEEDVFPETCPKQQMQLSGSKRSETDPSSSCHVDKGKEPVSPHAVARVKKSSLERPSAALHIKEPGADSGAKNSKVRASGAQALLKPKDEPFTDDTFTNELPIAVIHPGQHILSYDIDLHYLVQNYSIMLLGRTEFCSNLRQALVIAKNESTFTYMKPLHE